MDEGWDDEPEEVSVARDFDDGAAVRLSSPRPLRALVSC